jgi:pimeloyl-ACP methyl ester carboxylesterase
MADWNDNQKPGQQRNEYKDKQPKFIFLGHSFGCYVIQQLCIQRRDILDQTIGFLHLMPFIRMKADCFHQHKLDLWANNPGALIALGTAASRIYKALPMPWVDALVKMGIHADKTRDIALKILREPRFVKNFFMLGTEEIRDIPREVDIKPLFIAKDKPLFMLFAGKDQWAPRFHMAEIARLQAKSMLPPNIFMTYLPELRHDYVSFHGMSPIVVAWCAQCISSVAMRPHASSFVPLERELLSKL